MKIFSRLSRFSLEVPHWVFAGVLLLRLCALERFSRSPLFLPARGDMHFYNEWAQRILRGELDGHSAFYGLPLYPYSLALVYRLFGYSPFLPGFLQAVMDSGTAVLIYLITRRLLRTEKAESNMAGVGAGVNSATIFAVIAAISWGIFVPAQAYSVVLMPTTWVVFICWFVVWLIVSRDGQLDRIQSFAVGLLIGVAAMAIANVLFVIVLVVGALILRDRSSDRFRIVAIKTAVFLLGVGLGTSPCWIHNYVIARDPVFLSAHSGVNFWIGNNPTANGYPRFPPGLRPGQAAMLEDSITSAEAAAGRPLKRAEVSAYWSSKAQNYIAAQPGQWMRLLLVKARNFWNAFQYDDLSIITILREEGVLFHGLYFGVIAVFAIPGMVVAWRRAPLSRWIIFSVLLQMLGLMTVFVTERYRLAVVPGLIILAAYGLSFLWHRLFEGQYRSALAYGCLVTGAAVFVAWPQRDPALWALDAYNSGWQALESGNLSLAETKLDLAWRYVPTNPETNFALGNLRLAKGDKPDAASFYLAALQYEPRHRGALNNLAVIALEEHRYDLAEQWLRQAATIDPRNAKTHYLLASALWAVGSREAAASEIDLAIQLQPGQGEFDRLKERISARLP